MINKGERANLAEKYHEVILRFMFQELRMYHFGLRVLMINIIYRVDYRCNRTKGWKSIVELFLRDLKKIAIHFFKTSDSKFSIKISADIERLAWDSIISERYRAEIQSDIKIVNKYKSVL